MSEISVRPMRRSDLDSAMRLKEAESWNQTEDDWRFFLEQGPDLCLVATCDDSVVGTVTAISYSEEIAWIGMMLVAEDHRRMGVSTKLLKAIIGRLPPNLSIKLDATPKGANVYQKFGFIEASQLHRLSAQSLGLIECDAGPAVVDRFRTSDVASVSRLDERVFGANRNELIRNLFQRAPSLCWVARGDSEIMGYVLGREGTRYTHLGPICATSIEVAKALVATVSKHLSERPVILDAPAEEFEWLGWLNKIGFSRQRVLHRMFLNQNRTGDRGRFQYAICGPEFG